MAGEGGEVPAVACQDNGGAGISGPASEKKLGFFELVLISLFSL